MCVISTGWAVVTRQALRGCLGCRSGGCSCPHPALTSSPLGVAQFPCSPAHISALTEGCRDLCCLRDKLPTSVLAFKVHTPTVYHMAPCQGGSCNGTGLEKEFAFLT